MIQRVTGQTKDRFLAVAARADCAGVRMETAFACYESHPGVCSFYLAGQDTALLLAGNGLLCCGAPPDAEELAAFAAFAGVRRMESGTALPGFVPEPVLELVRRPGSPLPAAPAAEGVTLAPELWRMREAGLFADANGWYADACLRRRCGAVIAAVEEAGRYLSTAGIYALRPDAAYLSGVATLPQSRGRGFAGAAVAALCRRFADRSIYLRCAPALYPFYEPLGFALLRTGHDFIRKEEPNP